MKKQKEETKKEEPRLDNRSIETKFKDSRRQYWDKHKCDLLLFEPDMEYMEHGYDKVSRSDGNTIVEKLVKNAFEKGFDCGGAVMFTGVSP